MPPFGGIHGSETGTPPPRTVLFSWQTNRIEILTFKIHIQLHHNMLSSYLTQKPIRFVSQKRMFRNASLSFIPPASPRWGEPSWTRRRRRIRQRIEMRGALRPRDASTQSPIQNRVGREATTPCPRRNRVRETCEANALTFTPRIVPLSEYDVQRKALKETGAISDHSAPELTPAGRKEHCALIGNEHKGC